MVEVTLPLVVVVWVDHLTNGPHFLTDSTITPTTILASNDNTKMEVLRETTLLLSSIKHAPKFYLKRLKNIGAIKNSK